ncbi:MAG: transposase [Capsulimonadaceae bacterium]|nr:transposase [Capsulimonadaceae bacterium]
MFTPSAEIVRLLRRFSCCFTAPAFRKASLLVCGSILTPGRHTVTSALRAVGLQSEKTFGSYHRVLSRDRWSALRLSSILLSLLLKILIPQNQPLDLVVDETLERRRGRKIAYKGWFRDAVRSTQSCVVTTLGVRWLCVCVLAPVPWSNRRWALPFLTLPSLSEKICAKLGRAYRGTAGLTIDALVKIRQWIGDKRLMRLIADGGFSHIELLHFAKSLDVTHIGRLQVNAGLYDEPAEQTVKKSEPAWASRRRGDGQTERWAEQRRASLAPSALSSCLQRACIPMDCQFDNRHGIPKSRRPSEMSCAPSENIFGPTASPSQNRNRSGRIQTGHHSDNTIA